MYHQIIERIVIIRTYEDNTTLELNRMRWGKYGEIVYDLRLWDAEGRPTSKGFKVEKGHISALKKALDIRKEI